MKLIKLWIASYHVPMLLSLSGVEIFWTVLTSWDNFVTIMWKKERKIVTSEI